MPHVTAHAMTSCMHHTAHTHRQASHPYDFMACHNLVISLPFVQGEGLLLKLTASHFNAMNNKNTNWNVLKRILIAM